MRRKPSLIDMVAHIYYVAKTVISNLGAGFLFDQGGKPKVENPLFWVLES